MEVDGAFVEGRVGASGVVGPENLAGPGLDDREPLGRGRPEGDVAGGVALARPDDEHIARPTPTRARGLAPEVAGPDQPLGVRLEAGAEELGVGDGVKRSLVGRADEVLEVDLRGFVVEDRGFDRAVEELLGVAGEELVEGVLAGDVDREPTPRRSRARGRRS